jgi:hypothetical protein
MSTRARESPASLAAITRSCPGGRGRAAPCALLAMALVLGCGDGDHLPAATGSSFTIHVFAPDSNARDDVAGVNGKIPFAGAAVALDRADGVRFEELTDITGRVVFDNVDVSKGAFAFTVAAPGYVAISDVNLRQAGNWELTLAPRGSTGGTDSRVVLDGIVRGKSNADHTVTISTTVGASFNGSGPEYSMRVPTNQHFTAIVTEIGYGPAPKTVQGSSKTYFGWTSFWMGPFHEPSIVDLVLPGGKRVDDPPSVVGHSLVPSTASGTLMVPPTLEGASGGMYISDRDLGGLSLGGATRVDLASDHLNLDYVAEYVSLPGATSPKTTYWLQLGDAVSWATREELPGGTIDFISPPMLPPSLPMYGDFPIRGRTQDTEVWVEIQSTDGNRLWSVYNYGTVNDRLWLPHLPSLVDAPSIFGEGDPLARAVACRVDETGDICVDSARSAAAYLESP